MISAGATNHNLQRWRPSPSRFVERLNAALLIRSRLLESARSGRWFGRLLALAALLILPTVDSNAAEEIRLFNIRAHGATGQRQDDARPAIQRAIDACAATGGGQVIFPPGEYTAGTIHLRSRVHLRIEKGATLFATTNPAAYHYETISVQAALFFGNNVEDVVIDGEGTIDGQAAYDWREDDHERVFPHKESMIRLGKPLLRPFPKGFPERTIFPRLAWIGRSRNLHFRGLNWLHSPSWTINLYDCERVRFDGLHIHTSLKEGVWADGIDLDGCRDVSITNCRIETGDDCIIFISSNVWGPIRPCENITVSQCLLSSASAAVKFSEGNWDRIRNIRVTDCLLTNVNRGFVFSTTQGGDISHVVLSNLTIHCNRFPWFWAGDAQPFFFRITRLSEFNREPAGPNERPPGKIHDITIRNVNAYAAGTSRILGHAESWLEDIKLENVKLRLRADSSTPFDYADHALDLRHARRVSLSGLETEWQSPALPAWQGALHIKDAGDITIDRFSASPAPVSAAAPVLIFDNVARAQLTRSRARTGTDTFLRVDGAASREINVVGNDFTQARQPVASGTNVAAGEIRLRDNQTR